MDNSVKGNISRMVSYLDNFNQDMCDKGTVSELNYINGVLYNDKPENSAMLRDLAQNHTKLAVFDKTQVPAEKVSYKSAIDVNKMDGVIESNLWKNAPNSNSLFETYENKKNNLVKNEENNFKKGKYKPFEDDEDEVRPKGKKNTGNGFYMENNNLKRKK
jgi:hypothetical protein